MKPPLKPETSVNTVREAEDVRVIGVKQGKKVFDKRVPSKDVNSAKTEAWGNINGPKKPLGRK